MWFLTLRFLFNIDDKILMHIGVLKHLRAKAVFSRNKDIKYAWWTSKEDSCDATNQLMLQLLLFLIKSILVLTQLSFGHFCDLVKTRIFNTSLHQVFPLFKSLWYDEFALFLCILPTIFHKLQALPFCLLHFYQQSQLLFQEEFSVYYP